MSQTKYALAVSSTIWIGAFVCSKVESLLCLTNLPDDLNLYLHGFPRLVMKHEAIEVVYQGQAPPPQSL